MSNCNFVSVGKLLFTIKFKLFDNIAVVRQANLSDKKLEIFLILPYDIGRHQHCQVDR
jgi:hypothetical protein